MSTIITVTKTVHQIRDDILNKWIMLFRNGGDIHVFYEPRMVLAVEELGRDDIHQIELGVICKIRVGKRAGADRDSFYYISPTDAYSIEREP